MTTRDQVLIVRRANDFQHKDTDCYACGQSFELEDSVWTAVDSGGEGGGVFCPACVKAGPQALAVRARGNADALRCYAEMLDGLIESDIIIDTTCRLCHGKGAILDKGQDELGFSCDACNGTGELAP